ncbi:MAG: hypothetical protein Q3961_00915, partial [Bifidobacteriaceae bacterium]|nr:hypothetical protein [Bifidobacteriaceae bacterium]
MKRIVSGAVLCAMLLSPLTAIPAYANVNSENTPTIIATERASNNSFGWKLQDNTVQGGDVLETVDTVWAHIKSVAGNRNNARVESQYPLVAVNENITVDLTSTGEYHAILRNPRNVKDSRFGFYLG